MEGKEFKVKEKNSSESKLKKNYEIYEEEGLKISYNKSDLEAQFPSLMQELFEKKKTLKIEAVEFDIEQRQTETKNLLKEPYFEDFKNPVVIDFLRRCTDTDDALSILDYLLERKELAPNDYQRLKSRVKEEGGLKELILECGGIKTPGYYERKFIRKKN